jgi:hypothetical protein
MREARRQRRRYVDQATSGHQYPGPDRRHQRSVAGRDPGAGGTRHSRHAKPPHPDLAWRGRTGRPDRRHRPFGIRRSGPHGVLSLLSRTGGGGSVCEPVPGHHGQGRRRIQYRRARPWPGTSAGRGGGGGSAGRRERRRRQSERGALAAEFGEAGAGAAEDGVTGSGPIPGRAHPGGWRARPLCRAATCRRSRPASAPPPAARLRPARPATRR